MGKVKKKPLPTPDTNPVDGDELIKATKPKKTKKKEKPAPDPLELVAEDMNYVFKELTMLTDWISELETRLNKVARRLGL